MGHRRRKTRGLTGPARHRRRTARPVLTSRLSEAHHKPGASAAQRRTRWPPYHPKGKGPMTDKDWRARTTMRLVTKPPAPVGMTEDEWWAIFERGFAIFDELNN